MNEIIYEIYKSYMSMKDIPDDLKQELKDNIERIENRWPEIKEIYKFESETNNHRLN